MAGLPRWSQRLQTFLQWRGFTIVEILVVMVIIAILATIVSVSYVGTQRRSSDAVVQQTVSDGLKHLQLYNVFNKNYPANIANTEFVPPLTVAVALYTNAPQVPVYSNLSIEQNAQLFLNSCNGYMPITDGSTTYNTACAFSGNNIHVKGQISSNIVIQGPLFDQSAFHLTCGSACEMAQSSIISTFLAQGGTFPITVPKSGSILPAPTVNTAGPATNFCLEGRSAQFSDIIYHAIPSSDALQNGPCPPDTSLHYP